MRSRRQSNSPQQRSSSTDAEKIRAKKAELSRFLIEFGSNLNAQAIIFSTDLHDYEEYDPKNPLQIVVGLISEDLQSHLADFEGDTDLDPLEKFATSIIGTSLKDLVITKLVLHIQAIGIFNLIATQFKFKMNKDSLRLNRALLSKISDAVSSTEQELEIGFNNDENECILQALTISKGQNGKLNFKSSSPKQGESQSPNNFLVPEDFNELLNYTDSYYLKFRSHNDSILARQNYNRRYILAIYYKIDGSHMPGIKESINLRRQLKGNLGYIPKTYFYLSGKTPKSSQ